MFRHLSGIPPLLVSTQLPPFFPASGPTTSSFNGLHPKSEFLAIRDFNNCVYAMNLARFVEIARILNKPDEVALYGQRLADFKKRSTRRISTPRLTSTAAAPMCSSPSPCLPGSRRKTSARPSAKPSGS